MRDLKLAEAGAFFRKNLQAARLIGGSALIVGLSAWTSCSASAVTKQARAGIEEAVAIRETATRFSRQFLPATTGETDEWARTTQEAAEFGIAEASKVSLAQTVSRVGEVAGMSGVRATFIPADSVGVTDARRMGDQTFQPATFGLRLEATGSMPEVARLILRLPPAVEIATLSIAGGTDELKATFQLAVYQPGGGPQN